MSSPLTFGLAEAYRRLGQKGGALPFVDRTSGIQQVMVVADLSRTLASEVFEVRGVSGGSLAAVVGANSMVQFASRNAGGAVIEQIIPSTTFTNPVNLELRVTNAPLAWSVGPTAQPVLDVGGSPSRCVVNAGYAAAVSGSGVTFPFANVSFGERWFLDPSETLEIVVALQNVDLTFAIQWRELSQQQGNP